MAALAFVVADDGDEGAAIVDAGGVVEEAVPIVAVGAAIHQVASHDVEGGVGPVAEGGFH